ncbi:MAG: hypothetical protein K8F91_25070 [Candidatus Obscuribacterales bacterium]|nr:hypothetical protein [Candidatus Obscuribacterales bacterium]
MTKSRLHLYLLLLCFGGVVGLVGLIGSADARESSKWQGYLIDRLCMKTVKDDPKPKDFIHHHTKSCLLMPACKKSGYTLYTEGNWLMLDERGNKLAIEVIKASKRESEFFVEVEGRQTKDLIKVSRIREIEPKEEAKKQ